MRFLLARWIFLCVLFGVAEASGQTIRGFVRDSAAGEGVAGAVVSALDSTGAPIARVNTDARGHYHLPATGTLRLQALRIGFRPRTLDVPRTRTEHDVDLDIVMVALPHLLERVVVTEMSRCGGSDAQSAGLSLWDQARAGLLASAVARLDSVDVRSVRFERALDPQSDAIVHQVTIRTGGHRVSPFIAAYPASEFAVRGYMSEDSTGRTFNAPDADVLLDPAFAQTHCFGIRNDAAHPKQIGLTFRPAKESDEIVDVTGIMWMDTERPALRSLEFAYTSLEPAARDAKSGGFISFREMRPGVVFIDHWSVRVAVLTIDLRRLSRIGSRSRRIEARLSGLHESGGEVVSANWDDGIRWANDLGRIVGRVVDRNSGRPAQGARVTLRFSSDTAFTDSLGRFVFADLVPGPYIAEATDTAHAVFGLGERQEQSIAVERATATATIAWRSLAERVREFCRDERASAPDSSRFGTVLGRVVMPDGAPAIGAAIDARRVGPKERGKTLPRFGAMAQASRLTNGAFVSCNVERGTAIMYRVAAAGADTTDAHVQLATDETIREFTIRLDSLGTSRSTVRGRLLGVFDAESGRPIAGALVRDSLGGAEAHTTQTGTVRLDFLSTVGPYYLVSVRKAGFRPAHLRLDVADTVPITLVLEPRPLGVQELPAVVVIGHANSATSFAGFEERCERRAVSCFRQDELAKPASYFSDFLKRASGVEVQCAHGLDDCTALIHPDIAIGKCQPTFYVDGLKTPFTLAEMESYFKPSDIKGMEVYLSGLPKPARFDPGPPCSGSIVIWTK